MIQAVRGMNDILPEETPYWSFLEETCRMLATSYGYQEIRLPLVEPTPLFERSIGVTTDIVAKEMYTFQDRNGDSLTLRPEGTAGCVRAGLEHGLFHHQVQRLWYTGPMFRHERPQKGRYRQFYQFGVEAYGMQGPAIDAELIVLSHRLWRALGIEKNVVLQLNTLGTGASRLRYRQVLIDYFSRHKSALDQDSERRLHTNPLRILDSKHPEMQTLIAEAPLLTDYLDEPSQQYFTELCQWLEAAEVPYVLQPRLVRGLDYYGLTVFEWVTHALGAQGTVCAGGRYDELVTQLGGKPTPAVGFAAGFERIVLLLQTLSVRRICPDIYGILVGREAERTGVLLAERLRDAIPNLTIELNLSGGSLKSQFRRADKSGAEWAVIIGAEEESSHTVSLKHLRETVAQQTFRADELIAFFCNRRVR